jgi:imidazolonepropionase-like amidohydrolase
MDRPNERMPVTPFVSVVDSIDPESNSLKSALRQGITSLLVAPGDETVIGGQAVVIHPVGRYVDEMVSLSEAGMKIAVAPRRGVSRMTQMAELRRAIDATLQYRDDHARAVEKAKKDKTEPPEADPKHEAMLRVLEGKLPAIIACDKAMDVHAALAVMKEYGMTGFLVLGPECWKAAGLLADRKVAAVLPSALEYWDRDPETNEEIRRLVAPAFHDAGVTFGLSTGGGRMGRSLLWHRAATLVSQGIPRADALRAVTLDAAKVIGLADRIGSIEKGKDADLVIWTGDPLAVDSWVETVLIGGNVVYERAKDERLTEILAAEAAAKRAAEEAKRRKEEERKKKEEEKAKAREKEKGKEKDGKKEGPK